ncbi:MAG: MBOAT family protein [Desulfovibrionaceae bacterium]
MTLSSPEFALFLPLVLALAAACRRPGGRNLLLLGASCWFYAVWDVRFLALLLAGSLADHLLALAMARRPAAARHPLLLVSLTMNLGLLGLFKYNGFFLDSAASLLEAFGLHPGGLGLMLPLGISYYTFLRIGHAVDVFRGDVRPERNPVPFLLYCTFFPHILAGPLTRARDLLPQFATAPAISRENLEDGFRLLSLGLFKKLVLADRLGMVAGPIFANAQAYDTATVWAGTLAYSLQIYLDFSGYTDMARGSARCLGYDLAGNFHFPYLSRSPAEFWRRWHMSLSFWFRDYLYIPLGGNRVSLPRNCANLMLTMLLCGLWHGAGWTFVCWGAWHGAGLVAHRLWRRGFGPAEGVLARALALAGTLLFVHLGWVLFRAETFGQAAEVLSAMFLAAGPISWIHPVVPAALLLTAAAHLLHARRPQWDPLPRDGACTPFLLLTLFGLAVVFATDGFTPFLYARF